MVLFIILLILFLFLLETHIKKLKILYFLCIYWVKDPSQFILICVSRGRVPAPKVNLGSDSK